MDGREPRCGHLIAAARMKKVQQIWFEWSVR
jgi:hypothetical protein